MTIQNFQENLSIGFVLGNSLGQSKHALSINKSLIFIFCYSQTTLELFAHTLTLDKLLRDVLILPGKIFL